MSNYPNCRPQQYHYVYSGWRLLITLCLTFVLVEGRFWRTSPRVSSMPPSPYRSVRTTSASSLEHSLSSPAFASFRGGDSSSNQGGSAQSIASDKEEIDAAISMSLEIQKQSQFEQESPTRPRGGSTSSSSSSNSNSNSNSNISSNGKSSKAKAGAISVSGNRAVSSRPTTSSKIHHSNNSTRTSKAMDKAAAKSHKKIAKKLKNRNHTNLRRKILHASFGFFFAGLNHFIPKATFVPGMTILTSATLLMELLRYRKGFGWMNDTLHLILGSSLRKHEMDGKFTGSFYYFLGVTMTAALYPQSCATLGICQLAVADPTASFFGRATRHVYWSRIENGLGGLGRNKGILGFLGGAMACVPMNYGLLSRAPLVATSTQLLTASVALGLAGAFADLAVPTPTLTLPKKICGVRVPPFHVDDNMVVPVFSGFACQKIFKYMGFPTDLPLAKFLVW